MKLDKFAEISTWNIRSSILETMSKDTKAAWAIRLRTRIQEILEPALVRPSMKCPILFSQPGWVEGFWVDRPDFTRLILYRARPCRLKTRESMQSHDLNGGC
jgi:hypothetical protein